MIQKMINIHNSLTQSNVAGSDEDPSLQTMTLSNIDLVYKQRSSSNKYLTLIDQEIAGNEAKTRERNVS